MSVVSTYVGEVTVTNADFNGSEFDGSPFSANPRWLAHAIADGRIRVVGQDTDYAVFDVDTPDGAVRAEPGDRIKFAGDAMSVWRRGPWTKVPVRS